MIKFGSKVICIDDAFADVQKELIPNRPVKDVAYTIDEVMLTGMGKAVTLVEINNPPVLHPSGLGTFIPSFAIGRFREVDGNSKSEVIAEAEKVS